jgi:hypothetical protein
MRFRPSEKGRIPRVTVVTSRDGRAAAPSTCPCVMLEMGESARLARWVKASGLSWLCTDRDERAVGRGMEDRGMGISGGGETTD